LEAGHIESGVIRVIHVVGVSQESFSDAVRTAVRTASETIRNIRGVEVEKSTATVRDNEISQYHVTCKIAFSVERGVGQEEAG
jgi:flavin-binding protein dodecin